MRLTMCQEVQTKTVRFDAKASADKTSSSEVKDLTCCMYNMDINDAAYAGCYVQLVFFNPSAAQSVSTPAKYQTNLPALIQQMYT